MSGISYDPPLEQLAIFDPSVFIYDQNLSSTTSGGTFLNFPIAQGTETFIDLISNGTATLNTATVSNNITATTGTNTNVITGTSLVLTSGATTNTLNAADWTGNIKTVNSTQNSTHYLNFSDVSTTGQGHPQKNASLSCNPFTGLLTATTFSGAFSGNATSASSIALTSDNTSGNYYLPFAKTISSTSTLFVDDTTTPLVYNPFTHSLTATTFAGNASSASAVALTSDNTSGSYFIPFSKTVTSTSPLFVDNATIPLTYNPSTNTLTASNFNGIASTASTASTVTLTSDNTSGSYFIPFSKTVGASSPLFVDNSTTPLTYDPLTSRLACAEFSGDLLGNANTASIATTSIGVATTTDNANFAYNLVFCAGALSVSNLLVDNITTPLTYNPSTGTISCSSLITSAGISALTVSAEIQYGGGVTPSATFAGTTLTVNLNSVSIRMNTIIFTGAANTVTTLSVSGPRNNGIYYVGIRNNGSLSTSFLTGLGANILTKYSATVIVPASSSALMSINIITINGVQTTVVGIDLLT